MQRRLPPDALPPTLGGVAFACWAALAWNAGIGGAVPLCGSVPASAVLSASASLPWRMPEPSPSAFDWLLMAGLMSPLMISHLRHVRTRSFADRRVTLLLLFTMGYLATWTAAGSLFDASLLATRALGLGTSAILTLTLAAAVLWQVSPARQRALNRCHRRPPLAAFGMRAASDVATYGMRAGLWCVATCGPAMLAAHAAGRAHALAMPVVVVLAAGERWLPTIRPSWRPRSASAWGDLLVKPFGRYGARPSLRLSAWLTRRITALVANPRLDAP